MDIASSIAASRLVAQRHAVDVIANNIANANTPGFQAERVQFSDWLSPQPDAHTAPGGQVLSYTQDRATWLESAPGPLRHTGNPLDLAIAGAGYFTVLTKAGPRLTRDGKFGLLPNGTIADATGNPLLDTAGHPIQLTTADTAITIAGDGTVSSAAGGQIAQIGVVQPQDPMRLQAQGGTLLVANTPTKPMASPGIVQGALEGSNVQPIAELTRLIDTSRQFQFVAQFVQAESTRQKNAIDKLLPPPGSSS